MVEFLHPSPKYIWGEPRSGKGNLYQNRDPLNHIVDGEARALYWHTYRRVYEHIGIHFVPGLPIPPSDLLFCVLSNNLINPSSFDLRSRDLGPVEELPLPPGISIHVAFTDNLHEACGAILDRDAKRQDCLYLAPGSEIAQANYVPYFAPTRNQPLHVRLIHKTHIENPSATHSPFKDKVALARIFSSAKFRTCK